MERDLSNFSNADFDRGSSRAVEYLWYIVRSIFFLQSIPVSSNVRCQLLRLFGSKIGRGVVIRSGVNVSFPWRLEIGDHVWLGEGTVILSLAEVRIFSNVCVSQQVFICTGSHDYRDPRFGLLTKPITLEQGCWIAARCFIAPGVCIGANSVCSAGSVVMKSVPPGVIVGGNPAITLKALAI